MGTLWNTYAFYVLYANIDNFDATKYTLDYDKLSIMDKWLISKLNTLIKEVDNNLENYKITETSRVIAEFVDELSNWYVRCSRERYWVSGMPQDKINAYMTLYTALVTLAKVSAPMLPFITEEIYQNLVRSLDKDAPKSIHLCDFPKANEKHIDKELEGRMEEVLDVVTLGRNARNSANIKNRQPIAKIYVEGKDLPEYFVEIIANELNVKEVEFTSDVSDFTSYTIKPNFRVLGPKVGKQIGVIQGLLQKVDGSKVNKELNEVGYYNLDVNGTNVTLEKDDLLVEVKQKEGYETASDRGVTVVLDTTLTKELIEEGVVRELISKVQTMRKEAGFEVVNHIELSIVCSEEFKELVLKNKEEISSDLLSDVITFDEIDGYKKDWNLNGNDVVITVRKLD